jgi:DNA modification methylase
MPEPTRDRPSRNYEFLFLFSKQPDYYFDRTSIDVPARSSHRAGDLTNAGSVWETRYEILSDDCNEPDGIWRVNPEASPYRHLAMWPRALVQQMLLPTSRPGDTVLDPFAGSGTTGQVALNLGRKAILIESSHQCGRALANRLHGLNGVLPL